MSLPSKKQQTYSILFFFLTLKAAYNSNHCENMIWFIDYAKYPIKRSESVYFIKKQGSWRKKRNHGH